MIKSLRGKLTAFNTAITGVILIAMTLLCLFVSEQDIRERTVQNFESYMSTVSSYLTSRGPVSSDWVRQLESAGNVTVSIYDDGRPIYSMRHMDGATQRRFQQIRRRARSEYGLSADRMSAGRGCVFILNGRGEPGCIGGLSVIARGDTVVELMLLSSMEDVEQTILRQRMVVCMGEMLALVLLGLFSWYFTGRMLRPIQESQRRQVQFTAAASHELRTPLAAMMSAASAMERAEAGQRQVFARQIENEGQRMSRLIGDMLTLSSTDSPSWQVHKEQTDLEMLLLEIYESFLPRAKSAGLSLSLQMPEAETSAVCADKERLYQVLSILLDNALSYTPSPGRIVLSLRKKRRAVQLSVADTGPGVPDSEKKRIWERFHRGETARSDRKHFGLGLSIAAQIVKLHGGKIWVQDAQLGGAEFILELPLV